MIVADTNVIAASVLDTEVSATVDRVTEIDPHWIAPRLWRSEMRNVLALYMRRQQLDLAEAAELMDRVEDLVGGEDHDVRSVAVLNLARMSGCTAYDCEFVALAQSYGVQLVTFDKQVLAAFPDTALSPQDYLRTHTSHRR